MKDINIWIRKTKPIWLWLVPNIRTILLVYVLAMALIVRRSIDVYLSNSIGTHLSIFYELITTKAVVNLLTSTLIVVCGIFIIVRTLKKKKFTWVSFTSLFAAIFLLTDDSWMWAQTIFVIDYRWLFVLFFCALFICGCINLARNIIKSPSVPQQPSEAIGFSITTEKDQMQDTGWQQYAENLVSKILKTDISKESFAVGVSGVWGSGKTTFLNSLEDSLQKQVYLVKYNPWNSDSATQVSNDFFQTLISRLTISSYQRHAIVKYAKLLGQINAFGSQAKIASTLFETVDGSLTDAKDKAANVIADMPLPVVVIIDDLDRLDSADLLAVLRLVRVTANFKNLVFIVAYDKEYVIQTLGKAGIQEGEQFLKKIFPLEICLPSFEAFVMANHLYNELERGLNKNAEMLHQLEFPVFRGILNHNISFYLPTFRDVKRFTNQFCLNISSFVTTNQIEEINVLDFFYLELLHYYDFDAYQFIEKNPTVLLSYGLNSQRKYAYTYNSPGSIKGVKSIEENDARRVQILKQYKDGVPDLLWALFGRMSNDEDNLVRYPTNFAKYFSYRINKDVISLTEFEQFLSIENQDELDKKIKEYCRGNISKRASLKHHLISHYLDPTNEMQVYNVAYALLELSILGTIAAGPTFKEMFNKSRFKEVGTIPVALIKAIDNHIGRERSWNVIQDILTALVEFDIVDQADENGGRVEYESVLSWEQLKELSEKNFVSALAGRSIPIQEITNDRALYHNFLKRAVAECAIEYIDGEHDDKTNCSLLIDKLTEYYSSKDNGVGLDAFFNNLDPRKDEMDDYFFESEPDEYHRWVNKNIAEVFGETYKDKDFYQFIKGAFNGHFQKVNKYLKQFGKEEIVEEKKVETANVKSDGNDNGKFGNNNEEPEEGENNSE